VDVASKSPRLGRARHEVNLVLQHARAQRSVQVTLELVAFGAQAPRRLGVSERGRDFERILVPPEGPEVIPVRMHGLVRVAFVVIEAGSSPNSSRRSEPRFAPCARTGAASSCRSQRP